MLKLTLLPEDYLVIGGETVVQVARVAGGRAILAINAPKDIPIVRGVVLERAGQKRPECLDPPTPKGERSHPSYFRWNDQRERAVCTMRKVADRLDEMGASDEARVLRAQLKRIVPDIPEDRANK